MITTYTALFSFDDNWIVERQIGPNAAEDIARHLSKDEADKIVYILNKQGPDQAELNLTRGEHHRSNS